MPRGGAFGSGEHGSTRAALACDVDPAAVRTAKELLPEGSQAFVGGAEACRAGVADAVVANFNGAELLQAMPGLVRAWNRRGVLVLSGMRSGEERERVLAAAVAELGAGPAPRGHACGGYEALGWLGG